VGEVQAGARVWGGGEGMCTVKVQNAGMQHRYGGKVMQEGRGCKVARRRQRQVKRCVKGVCGSVCVCVQCVGGSVVHAEGCGVWQSEVHRRTNTNIIQN